MVILGEGEATEVSIPLEFLKLTGQGLYQQRGEPRGFPMHTRQETRQDSRNASKQVTRNEVRSDSEGEFRQRQNYGNNRQDARSEPKFNARSDEARYEPRQKASIVKESRLVLTKEEELLILKHREEAERQKVAGSRQFYFLFNLR